MKIYDVSMMIEETMMVYKNKPEKKPMISYASTFETGTVYESLLTMNLHTGTHMDFPKHIIKDGMTSRALDLDRLITKVKLLDMTDLDKEITAKDLENHEINKGDFVLFKTKNSFVEVFDFEFVYIRQDAAQRLAEIGVNGIGVDALGIERDQEGYPTHKICFESDIIIIEGLRLKNVPEGTYQMFALPLKIKETEALPLSVILTDHA
ncbi:MAG: cyclase family protein [Acholeplasmataceae bacterium]|nr:cyclase family protein [Acholeplasmataceae bacterium]